LHKTQLHKNLFMTWIITCFYLQLLLLNPLVKAQSSCGNPVTDDVNDITKLVSDLKNKQRKTQTPPKHCLLHLMVPEISKSLHSLLHKFSDLSDMSDILSNYSIINNLTRIINDILSCLENDHLYKEGMFSPEEFFRHFNSTIDAYKDFAETSDLSDCVLPTTTEILENDLSIRVTKPFLLPPVAASSLRNESSASKRKYK
uniref:Kit ligand n=1 Tax=Pelusios castaneus TaxID=367368 RepID=A0A8C8SAZ8_9SAUR